MSSGYVNACLYDRNNNINMLCYGGGRSEGEMIIDEASLNPYGFVHGGLIFSLCDSTACFAATDGDGHFVTQNASINYLRPASGMKLRAEGRLLHSGAKISVVNVDVYDENEKLVACSRFSLCRVHLKNVKDLLYQDGPGGEI